MLILINCYFIKFIWINYHQCFWSVRHIDEADKDDFLLRCSSTFIDGNGFCECFLTYDFEGKVDPCQFIIVVHFRNDNAVDAVVSVVTHTSISVRESYGDKVLIEF